MTTQSLPACREKHRRERKLGVRSCASAPAIALSRTRPKSVKLREGVSEKTKTLNLRPTVQNKMKQNLATAS